MANPPELKRVRLVTDPVRSLVDDLPSAGTALDALEELAIPVGKKREEHLRVQVRRRSMCTAKYANSCLNWNAHQQWSLDPSLARGFADQGHAQGRLSGVVGKKANGLSQP